MCLRVYLVPAQPVRPLPSETETLFTRLVSANPETGGRRRPGGARVEWGSSESLSKNGMIIREIARCTAITIPSQLVQRVAKCACMFHRIHYLIRSLACSFALHRSAKRDVMACSLPSSAFRRSSLPMHAQSGPCHRCPCHKKTNKQT